MGQSVTIKLKTSKDKEIKKANDALKSLGIENKFILEQFNLDWLKDINENKKAPQRHLKPLDRDLTLEELKANFKAWTEVGVFDIDVSFGRTSEEQMRLIADFIEIYFDKIKFVKNGDELNERAIITEKQKVIIESLEKKVKKPKKLPLKDRTKDDIQGGTVLCKSWGAKQTRFFCIYGRVDTPMFMKKRIFVDNDLNSLYRTKKNEAIMLIPLMPMSGNEETDNKFLIDVFNNAGKIGMIENIYYFLSLAYSTSFADLNKISKEFVADYTMPELKERFKFVFDGLTSAFPFSNAITPGFRFIEKDIKFIKNTVVNDSKTDLLTCLLRAMILKTKNEKFDKDLHKFLFETTKERLFFDNKKVFKMIEKLDKVFA